MGCTPALCPVTSSAQEHLGRKTLSPLRPNIDATLQGVPIVKLYMIPACPFVQRILIACQVRGIDQSVLTSVEIDLNTPPKEMLAINPSGSVPTLEYAPGEGFHESLVIMEFLDSIEAAGPRLYGSAPTTTAETRVAVEVASSKFLTPLQQAMYSQGSVNSVRKATHQLVGAWNWLDVELSKASGRFFGGTQFNAVDISLAPFIARWKWLSEKYPELPKPAAGSRAEKYIAQIPEHEAVMNSLPSADIMRSTTLRFLTPHPLLQDAINAPRTLLENPKATLEAAGQKLSSWKIEHDGQGFCLKGHFRFKNHSEALSKLNWLHDAQETTDHHTSIVMRDFQESEIIMVTHEPKWGVTQKDVALAIAIQAFFTEGQLP